jgi:hypothetical protein
VNGIFKIEIIKMAMYCCLQRQYGLFAFIFQLSLSALQILTQSPQSSLWLTQSADLSLKAGSVADVFCCAFETVEMVWVKSPYFFPPA